MASLAEIRARLAEQDNKSNRGNGESTVVYPHWKINTDDTAIVRFLPDKDETNTFFWVERMQFRFPFNGIVGQSSNPITLQIPCMEMYGEQDPILNEVREWFSDPSMEEMGRKYWKKRSYIFQGFVRQDPLGEQAPENPIRRFMISPQIFALIKNSLMDPEIEYLPTDYENGLDFRITKGHKGGYADYSSSSWARRESALTDEELAAIETYGLFDLRSALPPKPDAAHQAAIKEMFEASVNGEAYDPARWAKFYAPYGVSHPQEADAAGAPATAKEEAPTVAPTPDPAPVAASEPEVVTTQEPATSNRPADILAQIRARQQR